MQEEVNARPSYAGAAPSMFEAMLKILALGAVDMLGALVSEAVVFGFVSRNIKTFESVAADLTVVAVCLASAVDCLFSFEDIDILVPLLKVDLSLLDATVLIKELEELERPAVVDISAFKGCFVNVLGLNDKLADLEATALKSVVDLLVATGFVITTGVCLAWLEAVVIERWLVGGILTPRLCVFI